MQAPKQVTAGSTVTVIVNHKIPPKLGEQLIHVTLKADKTKRIERKVLKAKGTGKLEASFKVPESTSGKTIQFAVFIGEEYQQCLQHLTSKPVTVN